MITVVEREAPTGSVLVQVPVQPQRPWTEQLPPLPPGTTATVTVGAELPAVGADQLLATGYRIAGVTGRQGPHVTLLVTPDMQRGAAAWWQALAACSERVFDLRMGPVRAVLADEIARHLDSSPTA